MSSFSIALSEPVTLYRDDIGLPLNWRYGPSSRDIGDISYAAATHTFTGLGYRPLSPSHCGRRIAGDCQITWIRRTRIGGDSWATVEVTLGEDSEIYAIDILDGTTVRRTLSATTNTVTYTAADQIADFGAVQSTLTVRVSQLSATYGRGASRTAVI